MDLSRQALQTNGKLYFFRIRFELLAGNREIFTQIACREYILIKVQCVIYQWIRLNKLYKLMESFFKFRNHFLN